MLARLRFLDLPRMGLSRFLVGVCAGRLVGAAWFLPSATLLVGA